MTAKFSEEDCWNLIRTCEDEGGRIHNATLHIKIKEESPSFFTIVKKLLDEVFDEKEGRVFVRWDKIRKESTNMCIIMVSFDQTPSTHFVAVARKIYEVSSFATSSTVSADCTIYYDAQNRYITFKNIHYPPRSSECKIIEGPIKPFKAITEDKKTFFFENLVELEKFMQEVPNIKAYTWDSKIKKWVPWAHIEKAEDSLKVTIPTPKGIVKIAVDLHTGKVTTKKLEKK
ncbi:MAG: hypothetical protein J7J30_05435 [Candidatus Odinarchaeota archaeon]|nr:hypothetical protein [Candidatus Odinarchaeota archaeon]